MKYSILLLLSFFPFLVFSQQTLVNCNGNDISAQQYSVTPDDESNTLLWTVDGSSGPVSGILSGQSTSSVTIDWSSQPAGIYTLAFTETSPQSCDSTVTFTVEIIEGVEPVFTVAVVDVCEPATVAVLTASTPSGTAPFTFDWGQTVTDQSATTVTLDLTQFDTPYNGSDISAIFDAGQTVSVTDANGCSYTLPVSNIVDVYPLPEPSGITPL